MGPAGLFFTESLVLWNFLNTGLSRGCPLFEIDLNDRDFRSRFEDRQHEGDGTFRCGGMHPVGTAGRGIVELDHAGIIQKLGVLDLSLHIGQMEMLERPVKEVDVQAFCFCIVSIAAAFRSGEFCRSRTAVVNGPAVILHPFGKALQTVHGAAVQITASRGAHVHQQITAA